MWTRIVVGLRAVMYFSAILALFSHIFMRDTAVQILLIVTTLSGIIPIISSARYLLLPAIRSSSHDRIFRLQLIDPAVHASWTFLRRRHDPLYLGNLESKDLSIIAYVFPIGSECQSDIAREIHGGEFILANVEGYKQGQTVFIAERWPIVKDRTRASVRLEGNPIRSWMVADITEIPLSLRAEYPGCDLFPFANAAAR